MKSKELIDRLIVDVNNIIKTVEQLYLPLDYQELNLQSMKGKWSIAECIEHLNRYGDYYIPAITRAIELAKTKKTLNKATDDFESGWFGAYSIKMVHPDNRKPQNTLSHLNPAGSQIDKEVLDRFLTHQHSLLAILENTKRLNLNKIKIPVEFFKLLKLRLGDCLQFVIVHQQRHLLQAKEVLNIIR